MNLVPCVQCKRHVAVAEVRCPFCASALPVQRPQFVFASRLSRAAIFSAAVVACGDSKEPPKPAPAPTTQQPGSGDDDLEKMLDVDQRVVERPPAVDAALPDAAAVASASVDAGVPGDAGVDPRLAERRRREVAERKRRANELRRQQELERQQALEREQIRLHENAKPYGAPPARRRVV